MVAHRRGAVATTNSGHEALLLHQPDDALAAHVLAIRFEVLEDPRAAVVRAPELERLAHLHREPAVVAGPPRFRSSAPRVVPRARQAERFARRRHRTGRLLRIDERELHPLSFAKKAAVYSTSPRNSGEDSHAAERTPRKFLHR